MDIIISNSSGKPIYEQITSQIKQKIMQGELKEGDALPSMRLLAKDLHISVITTKRAYEDLERTASSPRWWEREALWRARTVNFCGKNSFGRRKRI